MNKTIVDTSVWIEHFRGRLSDSLRHFLQESLIVDAIAITDIIRHEILVGTKTEKDYLQLIQLLSPLDCFHISAEQAPVFDRFAWKLSKIGLMGKYTDASIAFLCHTHKIPILSFDDYFSKLAKKEILRCIDKEQ